MATFTWKDTTTLNNEAKTQAANALRANRDRALRETDWMLLPDAPLTAGELTDIQTYRQALRDAPDTAAAAPEYATGITYAAGDLIQANAIAYAVIQAHTSQTDWHPSTTPALYRHLGDVSLLASDEPLPWSQPEGAHDAYQTGDRVTFEGNVYESTIDDNVWSPTAYPAGWTLIE